MSNAPKFPKAFSIEINNNREFNTAWNVLKILGFNESPNMGERDWDKYTDTIRYTPTAGYIWASGMKATNHFYSIEALGDLVAFITAPEPTERQLRIAALKKELQELQEELTTLEDEEAAQ